MRLTRLQSQNNAADQTLACEAYSLQHLGGNSRHYVHSWPFSRRAVRVILSHLCCLPCRDLKLENVMIKDPGQGLGAKPCLIDFGLAKDTNEGPADTCCGTLVSDTG